MALVFVFVVAIFSIVHISITIVETGSCSSKFTNDHLYQTNWYRGAHGAVPIKMNSDISSHSQEWANHLASTSIINC